MHKFIVEDSTKNYPAMPDYVLLFKKKGDNDNLIKLLSIEGSNDGQGLHSL